MSLTVRSLGLNAVARSVGLHGNLYDFADLFQGAFDILDIGKHLTDFTLCWETVRHWLGSMLLLGNASIGFGKVEDCPRVRADLVEAVSIQNLD